MLNKLPQIQGIRALAIFSVFFPHTVTWLSDDIGVLLILISRLGCSGVATFLILSGFLLADKQKQIPSVEKCNVIKSAWQKVSKMYVLYIITCVVAFLARTQWPLSVHDWLITAISFGFNLTMTQAFLPIEEILCAFNAPAWFLSALFGIWIVLYLFPKGVNKLLSLSTRQCVVAIIALLATQGMWLLFCAKYIGGVFHASYIVYEWLVYYNPLICLSEYFVGVLLGRFCAQRQYSVTAQNAIAVTTLAVLVVYSILLTTSYIHVSSLKMMVAECFAGLGIVAVMSPQSVGYKFLTMQPLVRFGDISGYFFLIHGAVNFLIYATVVEYVPKPWLFFVSFIVSVLLSLFADSCYNGRKRISG